MHHGLERGTPDDVVRQPISLYSDQFEVNWEETISR